MIRFLFRMCGAVLLAAGLAALVVDGDQSIVSSRLVLTSLQKFVPSTAPVALAWLENLDLLTWALPLQTILGLLLSVPLCLALGGGGLVLLMLGRPAGTPIGSVRR